MAAAAMAAAARASRSRGGGCGFDGSRAWGGALSRAATGLGVRAERRTAGQPCRAAAGLGLEPESGSRSGMTPTGGVCVSAREGGGGNGSRLHRRTGPGKEKLGRTEEEGKKELGWATRKKREREKEKREWAGPN
jgi:hypothetical protein